MAEFVENELNFHQLANVQGCVGENPHDFRQLANVRGVYWRKSCGLSPIGECPGVYWRMSTGLSPLANVLLAKVILAKFRLADTTSNTDSGLLVRLTRMVSYTLSL